MEVRAGAKAKVIGILRHLRFSSIFLTGPSPLLGQFNGKPTTQVGLTLQKIL
jgi:hypothetical protein